MEDWVMRKIGKFLSGWIAKVCGLVWGVIDPVRNEDFYNKIDKDFFPE